MSPHFTPGAALIGGGMIGVSAAALLLVLGRIAGITGIVGEALRLRSGAHAWRLWFLVGLVGGGGLLARLHPTAFLGQLDQSAPWLVVSGLLVGFGTRLGNGCTSGHGVCGIGRLSKRSIVATLTFIGTGAVTVFVVRHLTGRGP